MRFNSKLVLSVLATVPSTLAAVNGRCTGKTGICISTGTCSNYGGTSVVGKCPNDPNDIRCCDSIPCRADDGRQGNCVFTNECGGDMISGKCPGGNDFKCCISNPVPVVTTTPKYFTISELTRSDTATAKGIDNTPSADIVNKLNYLITNCLDPIREIYGKPIIVSSGYRCEALNNAVGGVSDSQHKKGEAADLVPASGGSIKDIYRAIIQFGNFDQFIIEKNQWAHVSCTSNPRHEMYYYDGSSYTNIANSYQKYL